MIQNKENPTLAHVLSSMYMHEKYGDENSFPAVRLLYEMSSRAKCTACEKHLESLFGSRSLSHSCNNQAVEKTGLSKNGMRNYCLREKNQCY